MHFYSTACASVRPCSSSLRFRRPGPSAHYPAQLLLQISTRLSYRSPLCRLASFLQACIHACPQLQRIAPRRRGQTRHRACTSSCTHLHVAETSANLGPGCCVRQTARDAAVLLLTTTGRTEYAHTSSSIRHVANTTHVKVMRKNVTRRDSGGSDPWASLVCVGEAVAAVSDSRRFRAMLARVRSGLTEAYVCVYYVDIVACVLAWPCVLCLDFLTSTFNVCAQHYGCTVGAAIVYSTFVVDLYGLYWVIRSQSTHSLIP